MEGDELIEGMKQPQKTGRQMRTKEEKKKGIKLGDINPATGQPYSASGPVQGDDNAMFGQLLRQLLGQQAGGNNTAMFDYLKSMPPPETASDYLTTKTQLRNPEEFARRQYQAQTYAAPFAKGGLFEGRGAASMAPEAVLASQGNNAMNQWAQRGAMPGIDPTVLAGFNQQAAQGRVAQGASSKGLPISPEEMAEFDRQASLNSRKTYI